MKPILKAEFRGDGRGPELIEIHSSFQGRRVVALEYRNVGGDIRHVVIDRLQVIAITPEEVIGARQIQIPASCFAADLGRSQWLESFAPTHLKRCRHFQILFYDELVDLIAEGLRSEEGEYRPRASQTETAGCDLCRSLGPVVDLAKSSFDHCIEWARSAADTSAWRELWKCRTCGQLWAVDTLDKYQPQLGVRVPTDADWRTFDSRPARLRHLVTRYGGHSLELCGWAGCSNRRLENLAYCEACAFDHAGLRD